MKSQQQTLERLKRQNARKNFRYNRYLVLRYFLAVFFFANLYWCLALFMSRSSLAMLPLGLLVMSVAAIMEHVKLYGAQAYHSAERLSGNFSYQLVQVSLNLILVGSALTGIGFTEFYPFLRFSKQARLSVAGALGIGAILAISCLRRILQIRSNTDKHYRYIQEFEKSI